jgi:hypothetical protein
VCTSPSRPAAQRLAKSVTKAFLQPSSAAWSWCVDPVHCPTNTLLGITTRLFQEVANSKRAFAADPCDGARRRDLHHCGNHGHAAFQAGCLCRGHGGSGLHDGMPAAFGSSLPEFHFGAVKLRAGKQTTCHARGFGGAQIISTALGYVLPNIISRKATHTVATCLYTFFGLRLFYIAWKADPNDHNEGEVEEVRCVYCSDQYSVHQMHRCTTGIE